MKVRGSSWGVDYVRIDAGTPETLLAIESAFDYLEMLPCWHHGKRFVDLTGSMLELVRMVDDIESVLSWLAKDHRITRVDFFVDVVGDIVHKASQPGTVIKNYGRDETVYSHYLGKRGNYPVFARAYDAQSAGHYDMPVTRFELEYKQMMCNGLVNHKVGFSDLLPAVTVWHVKEIFGIDIMLPGVVPLELNAPKREYTPNRERFYTRYGKGIMNDIETMGLEQLLVFLYTCVETKEQRNETKRSTNKV